MINISFANQSYTFHVIEVIDNSMVIIENRAIVGLAVPAANKGLSYVDNFGGQEQGLLTFITSENIPVTTENRIYQLIIGTDHYSMNNKMDNSSNVPSFTLPYFQYTCTLTTEQL